jgi:hypothetical protein
VGVHEAACQARIRTHQTLALFASEHYGSAALPNFIRVLVILV